MSQNSIAMAAVLFGSTFCFAFLKLPCSTAGSQRSPQPQPSTPQRWNIQTESQLFIQKDPHRVLCPEVSAEKKRERFLLSTPGV